MVHLGSAAGGAEGRERSAEVVARERSAEVVARTLMPPITAAPTPLPRLTPLAPCGSLVLTG